MKEELEARRRKALLASDAAQDLYTMQYVMPVVREYERLITVDWTVGNEKLHAAESELATLHEALYEQKKALLLSGETRPRKDKETKLKTEKVKKLTKVVKELFESQARLLSRIETVHMILTRRNARGIMEYNNENAPAGAPRPQPEQPVQPAAHEVAVERFANRLFPCTADCNGFFRYNNGACMVCDVVHCVKCGVQTSEDGTHECVQSDVQNMRFVLREVGQLRRPTT